MRLPGLFALFCALSVVSGCGGESEDKVSVSGSVKIDGKAISSDGYSVRLEGETRQAAITVKDDGTFAGEAFAGKAKAYLSGGPAGDEGAAGHGTDGEAPVSGDEFAPIEVEVTDGGSLSLDFKKN